ncbi:MAG: cytochrome c-type biogenesis protein CcmH [Acidimicrobiales bacterium]
MSRRQTVREQSALGSAQVEGFGSEVMSRAAAAGEGEILCCEESGAGESSSAEVLGKPPREHPGGREVPRILRRSVDLLKSWSGWLALVLLVGAVAGFTLTGGRTGKPVTPAQRIAQLEGMVRCPEVSSCGGTIPVSDTNTPVAIEVKAAIAADVKAGMSNAKIERLLTSRYGPGIMLVPAASGFSLLLWLLPVAGAAAGAIVLVVMMRKRHNEALKHVPYPHPSTGRQRSFERRWRKYTPSAHWLSILFRQNRKVLLGGGIACLAAAASLAIFSSTHSRLSGEVATGSISVSKGQEIQRRLAQASAAESAGHDVTALSLYHDVLAADPHQPQALAESGWITYETGIYSGQSKLTKAGEAQVKEALAISPGSYAPHLYLGTIYFQRGNLPQALGQYTEFLKDHPPKAIAGRAAPFLKEAFAKAGKALPAG